MMSTDKHRLPNLSTAVWVFTWTAKKIYIPVHHVCISEKKKSSLLAFHAVTSCDTTSQHAGIGKQSAWRTFTRCPWLLERLGVDQYPGGCVLSNAEAFVCQVYNRRTKDVHINNEKAAT